MKTLFTLLLTLILLLGGGLVWLATQGASLHLGPGLLQTLAESRFPIRERQLGLEYGLYDPQLRITPDERLGFTARLELVREGRQLTGSVDLSGRPDYDPQRDALYLRRVTVHDLRMDRVSLGDESQAATVSQALSDALNRTEGGQGWLMTLLGQQLAAALESQPLFALDPERWEQRLAGRLLRDIRTEGGDLVVELGPL